MVLIVTKTKPLTKYRVLRCKRCGNLVQTDDERPVDVLTDRFEDHCPDPKAPGGYWYCSYEELVPVSWVEATRKLQKFIDSSDNLKRTIKRKPK
jgi:hypothetical protein